MQTVMSQNDIWQLDESGLKTISILFGDCFDFDC